VDFDLEVFWAITNEEFWWHSEYKLYEQEHMEKMNNLPKHHGAGQNATASVASN